MTQQIDRELSIKILKKYALNVYNLLI